MRTTAKRFLDIEDALRWTWRDELPKLQRGGRFGPSGQAAVSIESQTVGRDALDDEDRGREPGYPAALGDPHPDAHVIEAAVKSLTAWSGHRFGDDVMTGLGDGLPGVDAPAAAIEAITSMAGAVIHHARMGTRPTWSKEKPAPHWVNAGNGQEQVLIDQAFVQTIDRKGRVRYEPMNNPPPGAISYREAMPCPATRAGFYRSGAYCPLLWRPDPVRLLEERAAWCAWRAALEILASELEGRLTAVAVLPPAAPWFPWLGETDAHGRPAQPFAALREAPYRRPTREEQAAQRRLGVRRAQRARPDEPLRPPGSDKMNLSKPA